MIIIIIILRGYFSLFYLLTSIVSVDLGTFLRKHLNKSAIRICGLLIIFILFFRLLFSKILNLLFILVRLLELFVLNGDCCLFCINVDDELVRCLLLLLLWCVDDDNNLLGNKQLLLLLLLFKLITKDACDNEGCK
jgi:hypothetical protein